MTIPKEFEQFLRENQIDIQDYLKQLQVELPRYIRQVFHNFRRSLKHHHLKLDPPEYCRVDLADNFYSMDPKTSISQNELYQKAMIYSMDVSSAVAVDALEIQPNEHVLDLCCAPGMKLLYISELLKTGTVTGVDFSEKRLFNCRSLLKKYKAANCRLFCADGTTFDVYSPSRIGEFCRIEQKKVVNSKIFHAPKSLRFGQQIKHESLLYDKVLVDAECTHDGSISHIKKYLNSDWNGFNELVLDQSRLASLQQLQRSLLANGFRLLKPNGLLVYSTCSFSVKQNEEIVEWFLEQNPNAQLVPISHPLSDSSRLPVIKLNPSTSNTSTLFIAKITRLSN